MGEVTYYYTGHDLLIKWQNDPGYMIDNLLTTYASTTVDGNGEFLTSNTSLGTDLGTITKVEFHAYGYGDGDDNINIRPVILDHLAIMPSSAGWSAYVDVTADQSWTWDAIKNETIEIVYAKVAKANTIYCAKVEVRVTYTPTAGGVTRSYGVIYG